MHRLRIVSPSESGSTRGTEVWLDDMRLESVTRVQFNAELNSVCQLQVSLNVCNVEIDAKGIKIDLNVKDMDYQRFLHWKEELAERERRNAKLQDR